MPRGLVFSRTGKYNLRAIKKAPVQIITLGRQKVFTFIDFLIRRGSALVRIRRTKQGLRLSYGLMTSRSLRWAIFFQLTFPSCAKRPKTIPVPIPIDLAKLSTFGRINGLISKSLL